MYQRFLDDPSSVDPSWHDFFSDYRRGSAGDEDARNGGAPAESTADSETADEAEGQAKTKGRSERAAESDRQPRPSPAKADERAEKPDRKGGSAGTGSTGGGAKPAAGSTSRAAKPETDGAKAGGEVTPLRGAANAVVKNMNASLTVPTATSVRAVPAKLLADNRIVINNQLKRTRGGKISFTHLIGYAVVQALADFPVMNRHFAETDGKPSVVTPEHVNLGLAIDLPGRNGQRSLVVASIKGCENMNFAQFWSAYEDMIRKARTGSLKAEDFAGTTISLTNPGTLGTNHSVPRLISCAGCTSCCSARTASTTASSPRCECPTSPSVGCRTSPRARSTRRPGCSS
jgi:2-oxoglutarate decarboxylase